MESRYQFCWPENDVKICYRNIARGERLLSEIDDVAKTLGIDADRMTFLQQEHGKTVHVIDEHNVGAGVRTLGSPLVGDAMVTNKPNTFLAVYTADCVSIAMVDQVNRVCGIAHAGWKGIINNVAGELKDKMIEMGADLANIDAYMGPYIKKCCYDIKDAPDNRIELFREAFGDDVVSEHKNKFTEEPGIFLNLQFAVNKQLGNLGISRLHDVGECSACSGQGMAWSSHYRSKYILKQGAHTSNVLSVVGFLN